MTDTENVIELYTIVENLGHSIMELSQIGREGFIFHPVEVPNEMKAMVGLPMGSWQISGQDLIWLQALKSVADNRGS